MREEEQQKPSVHLLQSLVIACSMYSKIPMPTVSWTEAGMQYALCFFPVVGIAVGAVMTAFFWLVTQTGLEPGTVFFSCIGTVIPILITGGIHMDGFLDTADARNSHQTRERKLEILKDPHTGAFAIICCGVYLLLYAAVFSLLNPQAFPAIAGIYVMTRAVSGWSVVTFPKAKKDGLAKTFASGADVLPVQVTLGLWFAAGTGYVWLTGGAVTAVLLAVTALFCAVWYYRMAMREFGGMTGDLAGYFLQTAELAMLAVLAVCVRMGV